MALLVRRKEVRDAQADDVPCVDGLGHSPVVPHPRQSRPNPSYRVDSVTRPGSGCEPERCLRVDFET